ncbi:hypothetical protein [Microcoleus sp. bin38.metabat.b11b12b14.051]|uniref:hypothetical protein n=1 Tax=Microcoleus sp. bin38.metabat.b11b12b14.051 TaxID=2742709 RepID=UPI0025CFD836|nr:hypothetical protein [Microcoleus sp. bin38.metabat.b11b12b14.051]
MKRNTFSPEGAIRRSRSITNVLSLQNIVTPNNSYRGIGYGAEASVIDQGRRKVFKGIEKMNDSFRAFREYQQQGWGGSETRTPRPAPQLPPPTTAALPPGQVTASQIDAAMN